MPDVANAWAFLVKGAYSLDLSVQDGTGVPHLPGHDMSQFSGNLPGPTLCATFSAWTSLLQAAKTIDGIADNEPFRYDLVNLGREVGVSVAL